MATHHGKEGTVKVGSNAVAEIQNYNFTQEASVADDTAMGDTDDTHLVGTKRANGSLECSWDETDTNGQEALVAGASVTLNLYPEGDGSGDKYYTCTATITRVNWTVPRDGIVRRSFDWQANGALSLATVGA